MPNIAFRLMAFFLGLHRRFVDVRKPLERAGIKEGQTVLDFGCGPGFYAIAAARMVGAKGKVYALDIQPLAYDMIHMIEDKQVLARELHRVLKQNGILSVIVGHIKVEDVLKALEQEGLFSLRDRYGRLVNLTKGEMN